MSATATLARVVGRLMGGLRTGGFTGDVTVTAPSGATFTAAAMDTTDQAGAFAPGGATQHDRDGSLVQVTQRRLFVAAVTTAGAALPFVPQVGARATWNGRTYAVLGAVPVQPGPTLVGLYLDVEA